MMIAFSAYIWLIYGGVRDLHESEIALLTYRAMNTVIYEYMM